MNKPILTSARAPLTREIAVINEHGAPSTVSIPAERDLTVYVDKRELVTLMTLGAQPELLVLGYLRNQRLVQALDEIESVTVDWAVNAAAVKTRRGIDAMDARTAQKIVTTGCGQGSVFGSLMDDIDALRPHDARLTQAQLYSLLDTIRVQDSTYKSAGSVHSCALFAGVDKQSMKMLSFIEDVGRHNAMDTIAGQMWMQGMDARASAYQPHVFYTTGRLTSEMVIKSALMGVGIVVSRSGITQMGYEIAMRLNLCCIGRALNRHYLVYTHPQCLG